MAGILEANDALAGITPTLFPIVPDPVAWTGVPLYKVCPDTFFTISVTVEILVNSKLPKPSVPITWPDNPSNVG